MAEGAEPAEADAPAHRVFIALGSNIDAAANLPAAVALLQGYGTVAAASTVYETLPVGFADQPNFLNAAVLLTTPLSLERVLDEAVPAVERALRRLRDRENPNGPRTIDLDVAFYDDAVRRVGRREIPDPDVPRYAFMATPLAELDPAYVHPVLGRPLAQIAASLSVAAGDMVPRPDVRLL